MSSYKEMVKQCQEFYGRNDFRNAALVCDKLIKEHGDRSYTFHLAGLVKKKQGFFKEALKLMEKALEIDPKVVETRYNYANALWSAGHVEEAMAEYDKVVKEKPDYTDAWLNKGRTLHQLGRNDEAAEMFRKGIKQDNSAGKCWENLLNTKEKFTKTDKDVTGAVKALDDMDPRSEEARSVHFALGRARLKQDKIEEGFMHYFLGNKIAQLQKQYDVSTDVNLLKGIRQIFTEQQIGKLDGSGIQYKRPIFIVGMPRSGTTLVEQIIAAHSRVMAGGERRDMEQSILAVKNRTGGNMPILEWFQKMPAELCVDIGMAYQGMLPREEDGTDRITDKMPGNFRFVPLIAASFPHAKIIHVARDPMDTCMSCFMHNFTNGHNYSFDMVTMGIYYQAYAQIMEHWYNVLPEGRILKVNYEDLVEDTEKESKRILKYCDLEWEEECLKFYEGEKNIRTASMQQVRRPVYKDAVARWRKYSNYLGPLIMSLGQYAPAEFLEPRK